MNTVILIMNIFISFIIDAFVLQLKYKETTFEDRFHKKLSIEIEKSPALKSELAKVRIDVSTERMEVFLQRMFEDEVLDELRLEEATASIAFEGSPEPSSAKRQKRAPSTPGGAIMLAPLETQNMSESLIETENTEESAT